MPYLLFDAQHGTFLSYLCIEHDAALMTRLITSAAGKATPTIDVGWEAEKGDKRTGNITTSGPRISETTPESAGY